MAEAILGVVVAKLSSRWRRAGTISGFGSRNGKA